MESCVGKIGDEFDAERAERSVSLADALSPVRVILDLQAGSMSEAIEKIVTQIAPGELPVDAATIIRTVQAREETMPTYLGRGLAVPHGRSTASISRCSPLPGAPRACRRKPPASAPSCSFSSSRRPASRASVQRHTVRRLNFKSRPKRDHQGTTRNTEP